MMESARQNMVVNELPTEKFDAVIAAVHIRNLMVLMYFHC